LTRSIKENGLLSPILVRRKGDKYEAIFGHRRLAAYGNLQFAAKMEKDQKEREKYDFIPAQVVPEVTDEQMVLLGLTENLLRADISPLDAAMGLLALKTRTPTLNTAKKLSEKTGLEFKKVQRLLRLADSPEVVQQGVREGVQVPVATEPDEPSSEEKRTLDLMAALEFTRLHEALSKRRGKSKDGESSADRLTSEAIANALKGGWGFREIARYVDKLVSKRSAPEAKKPPGRPRLPFKKTGQQLVIYYGRLKTLGKGDLQSLRSALDEVLKTLGLRAVPLGQSQKGQR
jgi:ParB/RepB/Spo0J family partition protein